MQGFRITTLLDDMDLGVIYEFISNSYWGKGIPRERLEKSLRHSFCFAVLDDENQLVAFARLITDRTTFAYLADVFVVEAHRVKASVSVDLRNCCSSRTTRLTPYDACNPRCSWVVRTVWVHSYCSSRKLHANLETECLSELNHDES